MGFWTNKERRTAFDDAEDLAYPPTGGRVKMGLLGVGLALVPAGYGIDCLLAHQARLFGRDADMDVYGSTATALAIAYIAVGLFIHAHWFWGLLPKCEAISSVLKFLAVLTFLPCLGFAVYKTVV